MSDKIRSRKFLYMSKDIGAVLAGFCGFSKNATLKRLNMNIFEIEYNVTNLADEKKDNNIPTDIQGPYDNSAIVMNMISNIMMDTQQRGLNAKHAASEDNKRFEDQMEFQHNLNYGKIAENIYISLNKSCCQRKNIEICALFDEKHLDFLKEHFSAIRQIFQHQIPETSKIMYCLYGITTKKKMISFLTKLREFNIQLPIMIFCSMKNIIYTYDKKTFIANFIMYHMFHECNRSFDVRQFGKNWKDMYSLLFILALVNKNLLDESFSSKKGNLNLSTNTQSLGKSLDNPVYQIFSENSIPTVKKIKGKKEYKIDSMLLNRNCGLVSPVGINAIRLSINLQ